MTDSSNPTPGKPQHKWSGLGYEQVPGLANRVIARYLRGQRKNMERFFAERGMHDSAERMRQIRMSRQGMLAKNRMFQEVLNEYAQRTTPTVGAQTEDPVGSEPVGAGDVGLQAAGDNRPGGSRADDGGSVPGLAAGDDAAVEPVIEE
jgi:hypothetical protein